MNRAQATGRGKPLPVRVLAALALLLLTCARAQAVTVCVLDSGCNLKQAEGVNLITGTDDISDDVGHGTQIYELISACAPNARVIMLKCFDSELNYDGDAAIAALYAACDIYNADVINMSWTLNEQDDDLLEAVMYASERGAALIASAGNLSFETPLGRAVYPAAWECVLGVAGVDIDDNGNPVGSLWYLAGEAVCVCARADYGGLKGSSYAAARVSGVVAEIMSARRFTSAPEALKALIDMAVDIGAEGYDTKYGWGYIHSAY